MAKSDRPRLKPEISVRILGAPSDAALEAFARLLFDRECARPAPQLVQTSPPDESAGTIARS